MRALAALVAIAWMICPRFGYAAEYRRIELSSGRVLVAEIANTRADGLDLRTPQGVVSIRFDEVQRIDPIVQPLFEQQPPMHVLLIPSPSQADPAENAAFDAELRVEVAAIPFVRVQDRSDATGQSANQMPSLTACGEDRECLVGASVGLDVDVIFISTGSGQARWLRAIFPGSPDADVGEPVGPVLRNTLYHLLRLQVPVTAQGAGSTSKAEKRKPTRVQKESQPAKEPGSQLKRESEPTPLSFSPIPGLPAFRAGQTGRGLAAIAITLPVTIGAVLVAGRSSEHPWDVVGLGAATWWATSVVCNRALAPTLVPTTSNGRVTGAQIAVAGRF